jgi:hypothetical protein
MKTSWKILSRAMCIAALAVMAITGIAAQTPPTTGILRGQVTDPSGATLVGATVLLTTPSGASMDSTTNKDGFFEFKDLPPGTYQVKAVAEGFSLLTKDGVVISPGQVTRLNLQLNIEVQKQEVEVQSTTTQLDVNPANNANAIVLQGKDLDALSDDPDELQSELQALAGPSAGPNGGQIYIDGFTAGQLPPKASIREIRINQNPFSSEYDKLGYGRIEIFTKPGTDKFHGSFLVDGNTEAFNARNPFELTAPPGYNSEQYSGNIGGPINKKTSFFFTIDHRDIGALGIVHATVLCGDPYLSPVGQAPACASGQAPFSLVQNFNQAITNPQTRTNLSPRVDYQLSPNNTLMGRYQYFRDSETNNGVGQFTLGGQGTNTLETEHTVQLTDTQTVNPSTINEIRFQYLHDATLTNPVKIVGADMAINVSGGFNGLGSGGGSINDLQNHYEVQDILYKTFTKHSLKFGGRLRSITDDNSTAANFTGAFTFGSESPSTCIATTGVTCPIIPGIQVYQTTLEGLAAGLTIPQIQALNGYGGPTEYTQTVGTPYASVTVTDLGLFVQDDWKARPNLTISYGLRYETQNHIANTVNLAPRLGFAYGIGGGDAKHPPKTVLRGGFGLFYDRLTYSLLLPQNRFDDFAPLQQQLLVRDPNFFIGSSGGCPLPLTLPLPPSCTATTQSILYESNPNLHAPYTMQTGVTLERQLTRVANIAVTYLNSRGVHQFYTDNINPIDPANPPSTPVNPIFQYQSEGIFKQNQVIVNGSIRMGARLSLFGYYTLNYSDSDTAGPGTLISIPGEPWKDYGPSAYDIRNRIFMGGTLGLPHAFRLSPFMIYSSGIPFNITTGTDPYGDLAYNVRPEYAPCSAATQTKFGCFAIPSLADLSSYTPVPAYAAIGPGRFALMLRASKTIGFGPVIEGAATGPGGPSGGTFGRGPGGGRGGPGGGRGMDAGATNHKYGLTFSVAARNVFNNVNTLPPVGILGSPLFGQANGLVGRPYSDPTSNRRIDLQMSFNF